MDARGPRRFLLRLPCARLDQAAEQLDVEPGGRRRRGVPLHAEGEPVGGLRLDRLNDAVQGAGADAETPRHPTHRPAVKREAEEDWGRGKGNSGTTRPAKY